MSLVAALIHGDLGAVCTPDVHYEDAFVPAPVTGIDALERHRARLHAAFPGLKARVLAEAAEGETLVLALRVSGRQTGMTEELPRLDTELDLRVVLWCQRRDGRIALARLFADRWEAAEQLGVLPKPGSLGAKALGVLQGFGLR